MSLKSDIQLQDRMSSVIRDINEALDGCIDSMEQMERTGNDAFDPNTLRDMRQATDQAERELDELADAERRAGDNADKSDSKFSKVGKTLATVGKAAAIATGAVVAGSIAAGRKLVDMASDTAKVGDNIDKMSQKIGISAQAYQEWGYVFERSGTDIDKLQSGMKTLSTVITDAAAGSSTAADKLSAVGLSAKELAGMSQDQQLSAVVSALQDMGAGADRTAAATDLLGKSATDLGAVLNMTGEETAALIQEANEYGMVMSDEAVAASAAFDDSLTKMQGTIGGLKNRLMGDLLPGMTEVIDGFSDLVAGNEGASDAIQSGFGSILSSLTSMLPQAVSILTAIAGAAMEAAPAIIESLAVGLLGAIDQLAPAGAALVGKLVASILTMLPQVANTATNLVITLVSSIGAMLPELVPLAVQAVVTVAQGLVSNLPLILDAALQLIMGLGQGLIAALPNLISMLPEIIVGIVDFIYDAIPMIISAGVDLLGALLDNSGAIITSLVAALPEIIGGLINAIISHAGEIYAAGFKLFIGLATAIPTVIAQILASIPSYVSSMIQQFLSFVSGFANAGKQLLMGLWNGISNTVGWVIDRIKGIGSRILSGIKSVLGIHSPSKETAWMGEMLGRGLADGITASSHYAEEATRAMSDDVLRAANDISATAQIGAQITGVTGSAFTTDGGSYNLVQAAAANGPAGAAAGASHIEINVDMSGMQNTMSSNMDVEDVITRLANGITAKVATGIKGVV